MDFLGFLPSFGNLLYTLAAFVVALSVIVAIHEFGHYIVARWCGIKSDVFSIGFGPVIWSRVDKHGTRWQVAALPLGGFVKFRGDSDAASGRDGEAMSSLDERARRQTMHGAPLWARAATVAAGPLFNFILSIVIFSALIFARGTVSDPLTIASIQPLNAQVQELQPGDQILAIDGKTTPSFSEFDGYLDSLAAEPVLIYDVLRNGRQLTVQGPYPYPALVIGLQTGSAAMKAGLAVGDVILEVDANLIVTFNQLREIVGNSGGEPLDVKFWRDGEISDMVLSPKRVDLPMVDGGFETRWLIGITGGIFFEPETESPGLFKAVTFGFDQMTYIITSSLSGLYNMITGTISSCNLSGPLGIAETSGAAASQGAESFLFFIALLSTAVGLLNLFPIPILDGGHLVFHAYEAISGRPPSDRALRVLMGTGLVLLLSLMVFALTNDLFCP